MLTKSLRNSIRDKALLVVAALFGAGLFAGSFALGAKCQIRPAWIFALWLGVGFAVVIGRSLRVKFREPLFMMFFAGWLCAQVLIMLLAISFLTLPFSILVMAFELWIGYALAFRLFGLPQREGS